MQTGRSMAEMILASAGRMGMDPLDLATTISYETGGTFSPTQAGPTTQWGQHRGLIQFGEPQANQYGVDWNDPLNSQLGEGGAVEQYFLQNGYEQGMDFRDIYSIVNAGAPGLYDRSDENNGGAAGTVGDKVDSDQMLEHRRNAARMLGMSEGDIDAMIRAPQRTAGQSILSTKSPSILEEQEEEQPAGSILDQLKNSVKTSGIDINAGLSSLAEIITANARGEKADLAGVGDRWRGIRAADKEAERAERARKAAALMFDDGTAAGKAALEALSAGADLAPVAEAYQAATGRNFQVAMQEDQQDFQATQTALDQDWRSQEALKERNNQLFLQDDQQSFLYGENASDRAQRLKIHDDTLDVDYDRLDLTREQILNDDRYRTAEQAQRAYEFAETMEVEEAKMEREMEITGRVGAAGQAAAVTLLRKSGATELADRMEAMDPQAFADSGILNGILEVGDQLMPPGAAEMTAAMKEAVWLADPRVPQQQKDALEILKLRDSGVESPETIRAATWDEETIKKDVEELSALNTATEKRNQMFNTIVEMQQILAENGGDIGSGVLTDKLQFAVQAAQQLNLLPDDMSAQATAQQRFDALAAAVFPSLRPEGSGATSDWEGGVYRKAFPNIANDPATMAAQLDFYQASLEQQEAQARYLSNNVGPELSMAQAREMWKQKVDRGDLDTGTVFFNADRATSSNLAAAVEAGKIEVGSWVMMNGQPEQIDNEDELKFLVAAGLPE